MKRNTLLDRARVASPCPANWEGMTGDERVRFCSSCNLHVYNLAELTRADAEKLVANTEGRLCVRLFRRSDGTVLTRDCPVGLRALRRRAAKVTAAVFATIAAVCASVLSQPRSGFERSSRVAENSRGLSFLLMSATLGGEVTDPNGEAISGAAVTLINLQTNKKLAAKSDKKGNYQFVVSDFGSYRLRIEAKYFRSFEEDLVLHLSDDFRRDVTLDVGAMVGVIVIEKPRESGFNVNDVHVRIN